MPHCHFVVWSPMTSTERSSTRTPMKRPGIALLNHKTLIRSEKSVRREVSLMFLLHFVHFLPGTCCDTSRQCSIVTTPTRAIANLYACQLVRQASPWPGAQCLAASHLKTSFFDFFFATTWLDHFCETLRSNRSGSHNSSNHIESIHLNPFVLSTFYVMLKNCLIDLVRRRQHPVW